MSISSCVQRWESRLKVVVCIYHRVFIKGNSHLKFPGCMYHNLLMNVKCY